MKKRFFGAQCKDLMVRCCVSPDAQYLVSGSEDGKPRVWSTLLEEEIPSRQYECKMLDLVSDCQWNPRYNMFALCGFGQHFPVLVYVYRRTEDEIKKILIDGTGIQMGTAGGEEWLKARQEERRNKLEEARNATVDVARDLLYGAGNEGR